jgi:hypothetical protein
VPNSRRFTGVSGRFVTDGLMTLDCEEVYEI